MNCYEARDLIIQCWASNEAYQVLFGLAQVATSRGRREMAELAMQELGGLDLIDFVMNKDRLEIGMDLKKDLDRILKTGAVKDLKDIYSHPLGTMSLKAFKIGNQLQKNLSIHTEVCKKCKNLAYFLEIYYDIAIETDVEDVEKAFWGNVKEVITCNEYEEYFSKCIYLLFTDREACYSPLVRRLYYHKYGCSDCTRETVLKIGSENEKYRE